MLQAFLCSQADPSFFIYNGGKHLVIILIYVDDVIITGSNPRIIQQFIYKLGTQFTLKDLGSIHYFLSIKVKSFKGGLFLSQSKYTKDLLERNHMLVASSRATPIFIMPPKLSNVEESVPTTEFRSAVSALQYHTFIRPDIQYAVNQVCQHFPNPQKIRLITVKRILRYLRGTMDYGLYLLA